MQNREPDQPRASSLRDQLRVLRTYWVGMLVIVLLALSAASAWTITQKRVYSSTASGMVQSATGDDLGLAYAGDSLAKSRATSYVQQATSIEVAALVVDALKLPVSPGALASTVSASLPANTAIIDITATADTPQAAQKIADAWVNALCKRIAELEKPAEGSSAVTHFVLSSSAPLNTLPSSPNVPATLAIALVLGALMAVVYGMIRNQLDRGVRSAETVEAALGVSVIGTIPVTDELAGDSHVLGHRTPLGAAGSAATLEAIRELRTNLSYVDVDDPPRVLLVTSSVPSEGKSTLTANLATVIARSGQPVVVVDADMRHPSQGRTFGLLEGAGLSDVLAGRVALREVLQDPGISANLRVLTAGRMPPNPSELLGSRTMRELLVALSELAVVIVDAPPLLPVTDAAVLSKSVDGVLVVVNARSTKMDQVAKGLRNLRQASGNLTGVVLNRVPRRGADAVGYGYYGSEYGYYADATLAAGSSEAPGDDADAAPAFVSDTAPVRVPPAASAREAEPESRGAADASDRIAETVVAARGRRARRDA